MTATASSSGACSSAAGFLAAVAAIWAIQDPDSFPILPAVVCLLVLALSMRIRFDTPLGFTVPTQLAFVPLVFAAPARDRPDRGGCRVRDSRWPPTSAPARSGRAGC